jgi:hypothetical protein
LNGDHLLAETPIRPLAVASRDLRYGFSLEAEGKKSPAKCGGSLLDLA